MMNKVILVLCCTAVLIASCKGDEDINLFEKSADERAAERIAQLKADLTAPEDGWRVRYQPESTSGYYYILMDFNDDNTLTIKSDLPSEDGAYHEQTITYRIDNALNTELILENYSFFSYLFEQNQATFGAEFEFVFVNKTPNGDLVFQSKTDPSNPTVLLFQPASSDDERLLSQELANTLQILSQDIELFSSSYSLAYDDRDLMIFVSINEIERTIVINGVSKKSDSTASESLSFQTSYTLSGDSLKLTEPFTGTYFGYPVNIKTIRFYGEVSEISSDICVNPTALHAINGITNENQNVVFQSSIINGSGPEFVEESYFYYSPVELIFKDGIPATDGIQQDIVGANSMQIYFGINLEDTVLNLIGFMIVNEDQTRTFAMKPFTTTLVNNNIVFSLGEDFVLLENPETNANLENIQIYFDALMQGNTTFIYKYSDGIFELNNPCTNWDFVFYDGSDDE